MKKKLNSSLGIISGSVAVLFKYFIIIVAIHVLVLPFLLIPRVSKAQRREISDTFAGYGNHGEVVFAGWNYVYLPDKCIDVTSIKYNGKRCYELIGCGPDSFYAYTREKVDRKHINVNLLEISYADLEVKYIDTMFNLPKLYSGINYYMDNKLCLREDASKYYVYDLDEKTYTTMSEMELFAAHREQRQYGFKILQEEIRNDYKYYGLEITDKNTQEKKSITMDDLSGFPEGQYILSLKSYMTNRFFTSAEEKDGDIYILGMINLDPGWGMKSQNVVLKYDFESGDLSYYASTYYDNYDTPYMTIL